MIWLVFSCSIVSSILYRAGGLGQDEKYWIPKWMRHSWVRDWLCPLCVLFPLFLQHPSWQFLLAYGAIGGALTTYWDWLFKFDNFWFSGFIVGLGLLPLVFCGMPFILVIVKAFFLAVTWGLWSLLIGEDHIEEHGRGFFVGLLSL